MTPLGCRLTVLGKRGNRTRTRRGNADWTKVALSRETTVDYTPQGQAAVPSVPTRVPRAPSQHLETRLLSVPMGLGSLPPF